MKVIVLTSDKRTWLLRGFFHQWHKYDNRPIDIVGFTNPGPAITAGHPFVSVGAFDKYPVERWSNAVMEYLMSITDPLVEVWLEDYWLIRESDQTYIRLAYEYMLAHPDALRFDLTTDRIYCTHPQPVPVESIGPFDIIEGKGDYSFSWQVNIWRRELLISMMCPQENPWQSELNGTNRVNMSPFRVLGSRQAPVWYSIVVNKGQFDQRGQWMYPQRTLYRADWQELETLGYTHP